MSSGRHDRVRRMEREQREAEDRRPRPLYVVGPADEDNMCDVITFLPGKNPGEERMPASKINRL